MNEKTSYTAALLDENMDACVQKKAGRAEYIAWGDVWARLIRLFPDSTERIIYDPATGWPYSSDGQTAWVTHAVTVNGIERQASLPVTNSNGAAKPVASITSVDVFNTHQRALVKAAALHGLGLSLWARNEARCEEAAVVEAMPQPPYMGADPYGPALEVPAAAPYMAEPFAREHSYVPEPQSGQGQPLFDNGPSMYGGAYPGEGFCPRPESIPSRDEVERAGDLVFSVESWTNICGRTMREILSMPRGQRLLESVSSSPSLEGTPEKAAARILLRDLVAG